MRLRDICISVEGGFDYIYIFDFGFEILMNLLSFNSRFWKSIWISNNFDREDFVMILHGFELFQIQTNIRLFSTKIKKKNIIQR